MRTLLLLLLPLFTAAQPCLYLAYDGFDYADNVPLEALNGGAGWAEPWLVQNNTTTLPGYQVNNGAGSLAFGNLQTLGRYATGGREYLTAGRRLATQNGGPFDAYVSEFEEGIGTQTGGTLWMSALLRKDQNNGQSVYAGLHQSALPWCDNCTGQKVEFGYFEGQSDVGGQRRWTLRIGDSYHPTTIPVVPGATVFFALRFEFQANSTSVELYLNPASLGQNTPTPALTQSTSTPFVFRSVVAYLGNSAGNGALDEVRLAATYACVAPDNTVVVDLPPVAVITANPADGQAPFVVNFSGGDSYDPEGTSLTYTWSFGDGTPGASGVTTSHPYTALGQLTARLTVQDASGLQHTAQQVIVVRNENNTFPCLSSFSLLQQASCTGQNGIIRINDHPANFTLQNAAGTAMPVTNGNEFRNLAPGVYQYTANGNGCTDAFMLHVPIDSTTCPGWQPDLCDLAIGTNMSGFADWVPERPLRNLMKHVRPDFIAFDDPCFCWSNNNAAGIETDEDGYPTVIPQNYNGVANKVRFVLSSEGANLPPGHTYVLLYDGTGSLNVQGGATVTSNTPGRIQFDVTAAENLFFLIASSQLGNHVRNVRVVRLEDEFTDLEAQPFYPGFLEKIAPFKALRFMDWGATNHNPAVHWEDRTSVSHFTYATPQGVPYELMIQLANQAQKDVWICIPHAADSNYVAQMATLFRNQLDDNLNIYLEYSNEVWNWIFDQAHYNVQTAPSNLNYGRAMAAKAGKVFRIWHAIFGAEKSRVKRVLGLQASFNYLNEQILSQLDPDDWDYGSPTSYIGLDHSTDSANPVLNASSTPEDVIENARHAWHDFIPALRQDYNNVKLFGKGIVNYEGGQHFVGNVFGIPYPYQQAMWDAQYSPGIYSLYDDMLDTIRAWGSRLFGNFSLASPQESVYGSWGVLNDIDIQPPYLETAPKYQALLDNICPDSPTHVKEQQNGIFSQMIAYPNPSDGALQLSLSSETQTTARMMVYDMLGKVVFSEKWALQPGQNDIPLNLIQTASGFYRVVVIAEQRVWLTTVIIGRK